jgi:hypothetical protein
MRGLTFPFLAAVAVVLAACTSSGAATPGTPGAATQSGGLPATPSQRPATKPTPGPGVVLLPPVSWERACDGLPEPKCRESVAQAEGNVAPGSPVPRSILARCTAAACTNDRGEGATTVTLVDGTTQESTWSYSIDPPTGEAPSDWGRITLPPVTWDRWCEGLFESRCQGYIATAEEGLRQEFPVLKSIVARCTAEACTDDRGEGETIATFTDGTSRNLGAWGYAAPAGTPPSETSPAP